MSCNADQQFLGLQSHIRLWSYDLMVLYKSVYYYQSFKTTPSVWLVSSSTQLLPIQNYILDDQSNQIRDTYQSFCTAVFQPWVRFMSMHTLKKPQWQVSWILFLLFCVHCTSCIWQLLLNKGDDDNTCHNTASIFKVKTHAITQVSLTCKVNWNLNGGPWKKATVLSSLAVAIRKGLSALKSTELMGLLWPMISPTDVPVSALNTWPNLQYHQSQNPVFTYKSFWS